MYEDRRNPESAALIAELTDHPLLSRMEEQRIARQLKYSRASAKVWAILLEGSVEGTPQGEFIRNAQRENDSAIESLTLLLFRANIKWALALVNKINRLEFDDRFQFACIGLFKAIQKYDPDRIVDGKNIRISTYATYWIRQSMQRGADRQERSIRIPSHVQEIVRTLGKKREAFYAMHNREPTEQELCSFAHVPLHVITDVQRIEVPLSLDMHMKTEGADNPLENIVGSDGESLEDLVVERAQKDSIRDAICAAITKMEAVEHFDERKKRVVATYQRHGMALRLRYRIGEAFDPTIEPCRTLEEVGELMLPKPVTRERVRQMQRAAVYWLRENVPELRLLLTDQE